MDRLRTRNRSVAQDLLMYAMMIKSFLYMWRTVIFPGRTDVMKINVHPTKLQHTHTNYVEIE